MQPSHSITISHHYSWNIITHRSSDSYINMDCINLKTTYHIDIAGRVSHAPICKNNLMLFEEHCVIFYAKFVIDDSVGSRIINVIHNILFIKK